VVLRGQGVPSRPVAKRVLGLRVGAELGVAAPALGAELVAGDLPAAPQLVEAPVGHEPLDALLAREPPGVRAERAGGARPGTAARDPPRRLSLRHGLGVDGGAGILEVVRDADLGPGRDV